MSVRKPEGWLDLDRCVSVAASVRDMLLMRPLVWPSVAAPSVIWMPGLSSMLEAVKGPGLVPFSIA